MGGSGYVGGEGGGIGEGNGLGPGGMGTGSGLGFGVVTHAINIIIMISVNILMTGSKPSPQVELSHFLATTCLAISAEPWRYSF